MQQSPNNTNKLQITNNQTLKTGFIGKEMFNRKLKIQKSLFCLELVACTLFVVFEICDL